VYLSTQWPFPDVQNVLPSSPLQEQVNHFSHAPAAILRPCGTLARARAQRRKLHLLTLQLHVYLWNMLVSAYQAAGRERSLRACVSAPGAKSRYCVRMVAGGLETDGVAGKKEKGRFSKRDLGLSLAVPGISCEEGCIGSVSTEIVIILIQVPTSSSASASIHTDLPPSGNHYEPDSMVHAHNHQELWNGGVDCAAFRHGVLLGVSFRLGKDALRK